MTLTTPDYMVARWTPATTVEVHTKTTAVEWGLNLDMGDSIFGKVTVNLNSIISK